MFVKLIVTAVFTLLSTITALSSPALYHRWKPIEIANPSNLEFLRDSESDKLIWVKPPPTGSLTTLSRPENHPNIKYCSELRQSLSDVVANAIEIRNDLKRLRSLDERLVAHHDNVRDINSQIQKASDELENAPIARKFIKLSESSISSQIDFIDVSHRVDACRKNCVNLFRLKDAIEGKRELDQKNLEAFSSENLVVANKLQPYTEELSRERLDIYKGYKSRMLLVKHLNLSERLLFDSYVRQAILPAGKQRATYSLSWQNRLDSLKKLNPDLIFKAIPIRSARLRSRLVPEKIDDFYLATQPIFLDFKSKSDVFSSVGIIGDSGVFHNHALDTLEGEFEYSLSGACAMFNSGFIDSIKGKVRFTPEDKPLFGAMLTYSYKAVLPKKIAGEVNYFKIYEKILALNSSKRFISLNSYNQWIDESEFDDAIRLPSGLDAELTRLVKQELVNRVVAAVSIPLSTKPTELQNRLAADNTRRKCQKYSCKLSGWDLYTGDMQNRIEINIRKTDKWEKVTFGDEENYIAITDISLLN